MITRCSYGISSAPSDGLPEFELCGDPFSGISKDIHATTPMRLGAIVEVKIECPSHVMACAWQQGLSWLYAPQTCTPELACFELIIRHSAVWHSNGAVRALRLRYPARNVKRSCASRTSYARCEAQCKILVYLFSRIHMNFNSFPRDSRMDRLCDDHTGLSTACGQSPRIHIILRTTSLLIPQQGLKRASLV
ncbi:hypothetical protein BDZ85DRAFT_263334 [Elsinoe ampelina]|uniref:Uncharacterized protein n=1 Tax=Elsinoe ampelina TaxID=302913 RepID=A0A6A6G951_9PEZI|nr:hypothetical protein BDZ85DRAFT_263334 [Elsinoe ampelina]